MTIRFLIMVCAMALPLAAEASIVGQKRFLPLNVSAQKQRAAIIVPADPARASSVAAEPQQGIPLRGKTGFMPLRRNVLTIRQSMKQRNGKLLGQDRAVRPLSRRQAPAIKPLSGRAQAPVVRAPKAAIEALSGTPEKLAAGSTEEAILQLFGSDKVEPSHPFAR